jgi:hypothetical protein
MSLKNEFPSAKTRAAQRRSGVSSRGLLSLVALSLLGIVAFTVISRKKEPVVPPPAGAQVEPSPEPAVIKPAVRSEAYAPRQHRPIVTSTPLQSASTAPSAAPLSAARLAEYETKTGTIDRNQAAALAQDIRGLIAQGAPALPTIGEYLDRLKDVGLDGLESTFKYPTLRTALIDAAYQIDGPESTQLFLKTLQTSADPFEVGLLAKFLDEQAPGQFGSNIADAARETLQMAAKGELQGRDVAAAFKALEIAQQPNAAEEMQSYVKSWGHYALMGLAALPNEAGVPALVQQIQTPENAKTTVGQFALQMLAQIAPKSPQAQAALLQAINSGSIPDAAWPKMVTGLAGDQYSFGDPRLADVDPQKLQRGATTYHIKFANENFYSLPIPSDGADIPERQRIVDSLLSSNPSPAARQALEKARAALSTR